MKAGEAITRLLGRYGVKHVFGIPGTHTLELYRGLAKDYGVRHILAHHEQGAGFMADGYARASGMPGVCFVITGAGVTNIATPMGEAYSDSVPMLIFSPVNTPDGGGHNLGRLHEITDQAAVTAPLTAFSATAHSVEEIPVLIARALAVFSSERPRPVHISIPLPLLTQEIEQSWEPSDLPGLPAIRTADLERAKRQIESSQRPIIIAGGGTRYHPDCVVRLAEAIGCPVTTTVAGRGVVPGSHPLCAGAQLRAAKVQALLAESDLAILLGTEMAQTDHWNDDLPLPQKQIRVNLNVPNLVAAGEVMPIKADVANVCNRLAETIVFDDLRLRTRTSTLRCEQLRQSLIDSMSAKELRHWQVLSTVREHLPSGAQVYSDMTQIAYTAIDFMPLERANSWHHPTGFGTLGYALPAAIGGAVAEPERPTVVIVGDAGLQYTMQELPLAAELGLNITVLLWNNEKLQQIEDDMQGAGIPPIGVKQRNPDFKLLAESCGWSYQCVGELRHLGDFLAQAFEQPRPNILQINEHEIFSMLE